MQTPSVDDAPIRIERLELHNFKSFKGRVVIPFREGFTTISGPNGSGKSNIVDALLFVVGTTNPRMMRAQKLGDLIHRGPDGSARKTRVTLTMVREGTKTKRLRIGRQVRKRRSGFQSKYFLDGETTTQTAVREALIDFGLPDTGQNIILQGDVTRIITMGNGERRRHIEELAGVAAFDARIEDARSELADAKREMEDTRLLEREMKKRLAELQEERDAALRHQELSEEKEAVENALLLLELDRVRHSIKAADKKLTETTRSRRKAIGRTGDLQQSIREAEKKEEALDHELERLGEEDRLDLLARMERKKTERDHARKKGRRLEGELEAAREERAGLDEDEENQDTSVGQELGEAYARLASLEEKRDDLEQELVSLRSETTSQTSHQKERMGTFLELRRTVGSERTEREQLQAERAELVASRKSTRSRAEVLEENLKELQERLDVLSRTRDEKEEALAKARKQEEEQAMALEGARADLESARATRKARTRAREKAYAALVEARSRARASGRSGPPRPVRAVLEANLDGIRGTVADLIDLPDAERLALEIAAGSRLQNIVCVSDEAAARGIAFLKKRRAGRATFLPLNKIRRPRSLRPLQFPGAVAYAAELVQAPADLAPVVAHVFGQTVVVETLDAARAQMGRHRMVTLEGELLERSGAMIGGHIRGRGGDVRKRKLALRRAEEALETIEKTVRSATERVESLEARLAKARSERVRLELERSHLIEDLQSVRDLQKRQQEKRQALTETLDESTDRLERIGTKLNRLTERLSERESRLEELETSFGGDDLERLSRRVEEKDTARRELNGQIATIQKTIQVAEKKRNNLRHAREARKEKRARLTEKIGDLKDGIAAAQRETTALDEEIADIGTQVAALDERLSDIRDRRNAARKQVRTLQKEHGELEKKITRLENQLETWEEKRILLSREEEKLAGEVAERDLDETDIPDEKTSTLRTRKKEIEAELADIGAVNMLAIDQYTDLEERVNEIAERLETLAREREAITDRMERLADRKREVFLEAYETIDEHFRKIFARLADGEAQLELETPDAPFEGGLSLKARPKGKRLTRLGALSGGEKSLTALSFVIACQRYRPAPFYVFDEVDMFLDGRNTERLAHAIRDSADTAQFLVVSLRKAMLDRSDQMIGVVGKRKGLSKVTGVQL